jgi:predicted GH43/DUF377 family glycosyl hydrolase
MEPYTYTADLLSLSDVTLRPNPGRTIVRPFVPVDPPEYADPGRSRAQLIAERVMGLPEMELRRRLALLLAAMRRRIQQPERYLLDRFDEVSGSIIAPRSITEEVKQLIAAFFFSEYSFEAAALFNPSMIRQPETPVLPDGRAQFLLSLRAVGAGHVSSVTFRTGRWSAGTDFEIDAVSNEGTVLHPALMAGAGDEEITRLVAPENRPLSELVIFPTTASQCQGIEEMRLVIFDDDNLGPQIHGIYTAYDGRDARPGIMYRANDREVHFRQLEGRFATGKGMALFPRKIGGKYLMLSQQDQQNVWLLRSDDLFRWDEGVKLLEPEVSWEFVQLGTCGSPIEIEEGWLVLTHGVGPGRLCTLGACLLDKRHPSKVIARLRYPLLRPGQVEGRDGYVPNVVYSCGGMVHDRTLLLPIGVADSITRFATVTLNLLLAEMDWSH